MRKTTFKAFFIPAAAGMLLMTGCTAPGNTTMNVPNTVQIQNTDANKITVSGSEKVKVVPDVADLEFGVTTQSDLALTCQQDNLSEVNRVLDFLKTSGVAETAIQTNGYSLSPRYDWSNNTQVIIGYEMTTNITVTALPMDQVGTLLGNSAGAGVNYISSVRYRSSTYDESYREALALAIKAATTKAQAMAEAGQKTLGAVSAMEEGAADESVKYNNYSARKEVAMDSAAGGVMPGEVEVEAQVVVTFELK